MKKTTLCEVEIEATNVERGASKESRPVTIRISDKNSQTVSVEFTVTSDQLIGAITGRILNDVEVKWSNPEKIAWRTVSQSVLVRGHYWGAPNEPTSESLAKSLQDYCLSRYAKGSGVVVRASASAFGNMHRRTHALCPEHNEQVPCTRVDVWLDLPPGVEPVELPAIIRLPPSLS